MWKNSTKDGYERNPIDPDYQVTFLKFGMVGREDLEFLQKIMKLENDRNEAWNPYIKRLAQAEKFYLKHNKQEEETESEKPDIVR